MATCADTYESEGRFLAVVARFRAVRVSARC